MNVQKICNIIKLFNSHMNVEIVVQKNIHIISLMKLINMNVMIDAMIIMLNQKVDMNVVINVNFIFKTIINIVLNNVQNNILCLSKVQEINVHLVVKKQLLNLSSIIKTIIHV